MKSCRNTGAFDHVKDHGPRKHRGSASELIASAWLLQRGYEVFRNVSSHGPYDLVAIDPTSLEIVKIQVKTGAVARRRDGTFRLGYLKARCLPDAVILVVLPCGRCVWEDEVQDGLHLIDALDLKKLKGLKD